MFFWRKHFQTFLNLIRKLLYGLLFPKKLCILRYRAHFFHGNQKDWKPHQNVMKPPKKVITSNWAPRSTHIYFETPCIWWQIEKRMIPNTKCGIDFLLTPTYWWRWKKIGDTFSPVSLSKNYARLAIIEFCRNII